MSTVKDIDRFQERLYRLNAELIKIEKKIAQYSDKLICDKHKLQTEPLIMYHDQLTLLSQKKDSKIKKQAKKYIFNDLSLKKA